ncbi:phospholipase D family protein [Acidovorax soli]|uniref:PLD-like domain-containing protein n=2 Tax=Acidovorax soli TaxID=592050 RepID=A0A1H3WY38_9BURK|nr:phospholipase D family protein [Acidovorax soli]SDZ92056.1 PLD-like domain-containing protein [Acidovorax soli]
MTLALVSGFLPTLLRRHLPPWWAALLILALSGCAELPKNVRRPVSTALEATAGTALATLVDERRATANARFESGFVLLAGPQAAYGSRLAMVEAAQKTLDLQYYAIHADTSTERLLLGVIAAARRGVRVRVLLDDFHSTGKDAQVMRLAFEPNIEMRMFNPVAGARNSTVWRMVSALGDFSRVQQRMHNKLFIADNAMGVAGGRNLGDAYFGHDTSGNFLDLDVLAAGPIVKDLSRSFDSYWNNERAYPVQSLITPKELDALRSSPATTDKEPGAHAGPATVRAAASSPLAAASTPVAPDADAAASQARRSRVWDQQPLDLKAARFVWAPAVVLVDKPAKIPAESSAATQPLVPQPATPSPGVTVAKLKAQRRNAKAPHPDAATDAPADDTPGAAQSASADDLAGREDTVVDGLLQLMGQARSDLLIVSPYFVPGPEITAAFAAARDRGVRVRVLTNSLASNDAPIAHVGYARHRKALLAMGVELYEMHSEATDLRQAFSATGGSGGSTGSSRAMLHSKLLIMDNRLLAVGSMNLDMRSQKHNTEIALLIRSTMLARQAGTSIEQALRTAAWQVELQAGGGLVWRAPQGSKLPDATADPDTSLPLRLILWLLGPLAPDHLL